MVGWLDLRSFVNFHHSSSSKYTNSSDNLFIAPKKFPVSDKIIKLGNDTRAHTVCEQMLSILKSSNLNYIVKETPYSAFVTIRKRFVKD